MALQIAKAQGAHVTAVDAPSKQSLLRSLGADEVLDYTREDFTRRGEEYDLIFDVPGDRRFSRIRRALASDGRYIPIGHDHFGRAGRRVLGLLPHFFWLMFLARFRSQLRGRGQPAPTRQEAMLALSELLETGTITPVIDRAYPLREVPDALRHLVQGEPLGKIIITMGA